VCDDSLTIAPDTVCDELLECSVCGSELVVVSINPVSLEEAPQVEEDWGE
jgi:alpha-aminoadipate carrier protein LysW